ncbi:MAG: hypothetical protein V7K32_04315 [Nostoc sp.]
MLNIITIIWQWFLRSHGATSLNWRFSGATIFLSEGNCHADRQTSRLEL